MAETMETVVTKCGDGTVVKTEPRQGSINVVILESHGKKTPSCYAGKSFTLNHESHTTSVRKDGTVVEWDTYRAAFKNGKLFKVNKFPMGWFACKETAFRGNWIKVEIV